MFLNIKPVCVLRKINETVLYPAQRTCITKPKDYHLIVRSPLLGNIISHLIISAYILQ